VEALVRFLVVPITLLYILEWGFLPVTALAQEAEISSLHNTIQAPTKNTNPPISSGEAKTPETCSTTPIITPINKGKTSDNNDAPDDSSYNRYMKKGETIGLSIYVCRTNITGDESQPDKAPSDTEPAQVEKQTTNLRSAGAAASDPNKSPKPASSSSPNTGTESVSQEFQDIHNMLVQMPAKFAAQIVAQNAQKSKNTLTVDKKGTNVSVSIKPALSGNSDPCGDSASSGGSASSGNVWIACVKGNEVGKSWLTFSYNSTNSKTNSKTVYIEIKPRKTALSVGAGFGTAYKAQAYSSVSGTQPNTNVIGENDTYWPASLISLAHVGLTDIKTGSGFIGVWGSLGVDTSSKNVDIGVSFSPPNSDEIFFTIGMHPETTQQLVNGSTGAVIPQGGSIVSRNLTLPRLFLSITADTSVIGKLFGGGSSSASSTPSSSGQ
jgi:hypothetical protein